MITNHDPWFPTEPASSRQRGPVLLRWLVAAFDPIDEAIARRRRRLLGRRKWLLSWHREPLGHWRARLSGPVTVTTIERSGLTRCGAIARTTRAMARLKMLRARIASHRLDRLDTPH